MPIYEYSCPQCNGRFQKLVQGFSDPPGLACPRCGSASVRRAVSRFATLKSEEARVDALANPASFAGLDESDPRSIARWAKQMGKQLGEDAGEDWDDMVEQMMDEEMDADEEKSDRPEKQKEDDLGWG